LAVTAAIRAIEGLGAQFKAYRRQIRTAVFPLPVPRCDPAFLPRGQVAVRFGEEGAAALRNQVAISCVLDRMTGDQPNFQWASTQGPPDRSTREIGARGRSLGVRIFVIAFKEDPASTMSRATPPSASTSY
jgi:hypothetical protein